MTMVGREPGLPDESAERECLSSKNGGKPEPGVQSHGNGDSGQGDR